MKTTNQLIDIARAGGGIRIDASTKTTDQLVDIARAASNKMVHLTLANANAKTTDQLIQIARAGKGCVVFDFVE